MAWSQCGPGGYKGGDDEDQLETTATTTTITTTTTTTTTTGFRPDRLWQPDQEGQA